MKGWQESRLLSSLVPQCLLAHSVAPPLPLPLPPPPCLPCSHYSYFMEVSGTDWLHRTSCVGVGLAAAQRDALILEDLVDMWALPPAPAKNWMDRGELQSRDMLARSLSSLDRTMLVLKVGNGGKWEWGGVGWSRDPISDTMHFAFSRHSAFCIQSVALASEGCATPITSHHVAQPWNSAINLFLLVQACPAQHVLPPM